MTASYELPLFKQFDKYVRTPEIIQDRIKVVIPVFNDWKGLKITLDSLQNLTNKPNKIIVVNDGSKKDVPNWINNYNVEMTSLSANRGPAFARNVGFGLIETPIINECGMFNVFKAMEYPNFIRPNDPFYDPEIREEEIEGRRTFRRDSDFDWVYFTDCGCRHSKDIFDAFSEKRKEYGDSVIAICGATGGYGSGKINRYMTEQGVLNPPLEDYLYGKKIAQSVITANVLIYGLAFSYINGFNSAFKEAAGEDLDIGIRLRQFGMIVYEPKAKVQHEFKEDIRDFQNRFRRYGKGNRFLEILHNLPSLRAATIKAELSEFQELADLQVKSMQEGYDLVVNKKLIGRIIE